MDLDKGLKRKQKRNGKKFLPIFRFIYFFSSFSRQNVKVCVVQEDAYRVVRGSRSDASIRFAPLSLTQTDCGGGLHI